MAKTTRAARQEDVAQGEPLHHPPVPLPAGGDLAEFVAADAGAGVSTASEDNIVPLVYVLQATSPQCLPDQGVYIEGAHAGNIWLRNASHPLVDGRRGMLYQPCHFYKDWVKWRPRDSGGGFVGRVAPNPGEEVEQFLVRLGAHLVEDPRQPNRIRYVLPDGLDLVETRYHVGYVAGLAEVGDIGPPLPFVIPLSGTGHTFSRTWMFQMGQKRISGVPAPSFAAYYRLTTRLRKNTSGQWYALESSDAGTQGEGDRTMWVGRDAYLMGRALHAAFKSGEKSAEAPEAHPSEVSTDNIPF